MMADEKLMAKSQHSLDKVTESVARIPRRCGSMAIRRWAWSTQAAWSSAGAAERLLRRGTRGRRARGGRRQSRRQTSPRSRDSDTQATGLSRSSPARRPTHPPLRSRRSGAKDPELKSMLGIRSAQEEKVSNREGKAARDTVTPAPAPAPAAPTVPSGCRYGEPVHDEERRGTSGRDRGPGQPR